MTQAPPPLQTSWTPEPRPRMATWKIVMLTLGGVLGAILIFVGGFVAGVATSDLAGSAAGGSGSLGGSGGGPGSGSGGSGSGSGSGSTGQDDASSPGSSDFPECLVGTWETTSYEHRAVSPEGESVMTGLTRTFTFDELGKHVVTYENSAASMNVAGNDSEIVFDGTVNYQVSVRGSTMSFQLDSVDGTTTTTVDGAEPKEEKLKPGTGDVTFTCDGDTYTESVESDRETFKETAKRVG